MRHGEATKEILFPLLTGVMLVLFSVVAVMSAAGTYRISLEGSRNLLESRAVDIAVNLGLSLEKIGLSPDLFQDFLKKNSLLDIAFIALYTPDRQVVLHSNPLLVGRTCPDESAIRVFEKEAPLSTFEKLATGEEVFILDFPLRLHPKGGTGGLYSMRVALHPWPAREVMRKANVQLVLVGSSLAFLWVLTAFLLASWKKNENLRQRLLESERLASLGKMAAVLAHEIRNPLSSIKGFAQLHLAGATDQFLREDLSIIVEESRRLEALTDDLLSYARPLSPSPTEIRLEALKRELERIAQDSGIVSVHVEPDPRNVFLDKEKFFQIARNLIQNASDAVSGVPDGHVTCRVGREGDRLTLVIGDNGPGFPDKVKARLFEPFVTTKTRGTGLGLAIVKRLVDVMGGEISVRDRKEGGAEIRVEIPIGEGHAQTPEEVDGRG
ncbi:MAG: hypothetical protein K6360_00345 [Deltaproteobacteria bacterium]